MTKRPSLSLAKAMGELSEDITPKPAALVAKAREPVNDPAPPAALPGKAKAATREGMKRLLTPVAPQLHKRLKMLAAEQETTLEAITRAALEEYLSKHHSK